MKCVRHIPWVMHVLLLMFALQTRAFYAKTPSKTILAEGMSCCASIKTTRAHRASRMPRLRGGADVTVQNHEEDKATLTKLVELVQNLKKEAGVAPTDQLAIGYQVVGGRQEHIEAARTLFKTHAPTILAYLQVLIKELPSLYSIMADTLDEDEGTFQDHTPAPWGSSNPHHAHAHVPKVPPKLSANFSITCDSTAPGELVGIVGSCKELGSWKDPVLMNPSNFPTWTVEVPMFELHDNILYKYVRFFVEGGGGKITEWEPVGDSNTRKLSLSTSTAKTKIVVVNDGSYGAITARSVQFGAAAPELDKKKIDVSPIQLTHPGEGQTAGQAITPQLTRSKSIEELLKASGGHGEVVSETIEEVK